jgi:ABC-2 type transport system permease protein
MLFWNPNHFERRLLTENKTTLSVSINAIDGAAAGVENVYITQIIASFNQKIQSQLYQYNGNNFVQPQNIVTIPSFWYNNTLNYKTLMVPGILVLLVTMLTLFYRLWILYEKRNRDIGTNKCYPNKKTPVHHRKLFRFGYWV